MTHRTTPSTSPNDRRSRVAVRRAVRLAKSLARGPFELLRRVHRDERGTISLLTVFTIFILTILLGMVFNIARQLDDKLRMQSTADAACYTGTLTMSRGMNTIAFTNNLMCEVFALTAYMREGQQRYSETFMPDVLATWSEVGTIFAQEGARSGYQKFANLGQAIVDKIQYERAVIAAFSEMTFEHSRMTLPVFEYILRTDEGRPPTSNSDVPPEVPLGGLIPRFQRAVVLATPQMAQAAAHEIAERHGRAAREQHDDVNVTTVMYRTDRVRFDEGDEYDRDSRTLPAVDPSPTGFDDTTIYEGYFVYSRDRREDLSHFYRREWIAYWMDRYFHHNRFENRPSRNVASLSRFRTFWHRFTECQLDKMLTQEFPTTNLPFMIRIRNPNRHRDRDFLSLDRNPISRDDYPTPNQEANQVLHDEYTFVAVVAWPQLEESFPGVFGNPLNGDPTSPADNTYAVTFAQGSMFIPRARYWCCPWRGRVMVNSTSAPSHQSGWINFYDSWSSEWSLINQNWRTRLEPVTTDSIAEILARNPEGTVTNLQSPVVNVTPEQIHNISMH